MWAKRSQPTMHTQTRMGPPTVKTLTLMACRSRWPSTCRLRQDRSSPQVAKCMAAALAKACCAKLANTAKMAVAQASCKANMTAGAPVAKLVRRALSLVGRLVRGSLPKPAAAARIASGAPRAWCGAQQKRTAIFLRAGPPPVREEQMTTLRGVRRAAESHQLRGMRAHKRRLTKAAMSSETRLWCPIVPTMLSMRRSAPRRWRGPTETEAAALACFQASRSAAVPLR